MPHLSAGEIISLCTSLVVVIVFLARLGPALDHQAKATSDLAKAVDRLTERDAQKEARLVRVETLLDTLTR